MPNRELEQLGTEYWDGYLEQHPTQGTALGEHQYDDRLNDITPAGQERALRRLRDLQQRLGGLATDSLTDEEQLSVSALRHLLRAEVAFLNADATAYTVDAMSGPQVSFLDIASYQPLRDPTDAATMLTRWRAMGPWIDDFITNLRRGLGEGLSSIAVSVERVSAELDALLARPVENWPLLDPLQQVHESWSHSEWRTFGDELTASVREVVQPAFVRYRAFLRDEALPAARDEARAGICHLPGGLERYRSLVPAHTTVDATPEELHHLGLNEVERIDTEMAELGARVLATADLKATQEALRGDPKLYFSTRDEIQQVAERSLAAANAAIPDWFGRLPQTPCEVAHMLPHEEEHSTIAYYREPAIGERPGRYYVNTSAPQTRPRYEAEALAFHEAVPGHHLQVAIGQELTGLPTFRRHADVTAFIEGWGLYSERLANEMGLYSSDLDRIGMLSYDAWRACRLVVDTGLHALGWSRSRAITFMTDHSALAINNITNEVDRYLGWPGQALAYKVGQLQIRRLRTDAEAALGQRFDIRTFHDALLGHGPLPLATMREAVSRDMQLSL